MRARKVSSSSSPAPPVKALGFVTAVTAVGQAVRNRTAPGTTLPPGPASTASAGTSAYSAPTGITASSVVRTRTSSAVMHTVPAGMEISMAGAASTEKRREPPDRVAPSRFSPRMLPWRSR